MQFWFLKCFLSIECFPRETAKGSMKSLYLFPVVTNKDAAPSWWSLGSEAVLPLPKVCENCNISQEWGLCLYLLSSLLGEPGFFKMFSASFACHCFGLLPCFLDRSLAWLIATEAGAETSIVVKSAVQPLSSEDQAHKQSICLWRDKITRASSKGSIGSTFP